VAGEVDESGDHREVVEPVPVHQRLGHLGFDVVPCGLRRVLDGVVRRDDPGPLHVGVTAEFHHAAQVQAVADRDGGEAGLGDLVGEAGLAGEPDLVPAGAQRPGERDHVLEDGPLWIGDEQDAHRVSSFSVVSA
jgi:hypothetical protein